MFHFTEYVNDPATRYQLAQKFLYFVAVVIGINLVFFTCIVLKKIYLAIASYFKNRASKKSKITTEKG